MRGCVRAAISRQQAALSAAPPVVPPACIPRCSVLPLAENGITQHMALAVNYARTSHALLGYVLEVANVSTSSNKVGALVVGGVKRPLTIRGRACRLPVHLQGSLVGG